MTEDEQQAMTYIRAAEDAINLACSISVKALTKAGCEAPVYATAAGLFAVLCSTVEKFYQKAGYSREDASIAMEKAMRPIGDTIDDLYAQGRNDSYLPPTSLN
jgi:hypothetical protein